MPLTSTANLGNFRLAAGEAFVVQMLVDEGDEADARAFVMSIYDQDRAIVDKIDGVQSDDLFEFIRPGTWSEGLYGQPGLKIEIAERLKDGRAVIATPSLTIEASAATVADYTNSVIARTAVLITASFTPRGLVVASADTVRYDPGSSSTPNPGPQLTLTGPLTFSASAPSGTEVASIGNVPAGVTPTLTPGDGRLVIAGSAGAWKVVTGLSASNAGTINITVAAAGATSVSAPVTVTTGATALPRMGALVAKWSADSLPVIANGANIPSWTDEIGGNVATTIGTVTYKTNTENGKPSTNWVGQGSNRMEVASPTAALLNALNSPVKTVLMVIKNPTADSGYIPAVFSASAGGDSLIYTASSNASAGVAGRFKNSTTAMYVPTPTGMFTMGGTSTNVANGAGTGLERVYVQGGCVAPFVAPVPAATGTITIGNLAGAPGGGLFGYGGEIAEILVWNVDITPIEVIQFQKWVSEKYGRPLPWTAKDKFTLFPGDSLTGNVGATAAVQGYPYKAAQILGLPYGAWSNLGIGGINMSNMNVRAPTEIDPTAAITGVPTHLAVFEYHNQAGPAPTPANNSRAYLAARAAAGINKIAFGTSTAGPTSTTDRGAYNAAFDSSHTDSQAYVPIHTNANIGVNGAQTNTTYFDQDTVHLADAGYTVLAGLFATQMATL